MVSCSVLPRQCWVLSLYRWSRQLSLNLWSTVMGLHESAPVVSVFVTVSRNVGTERVTIMDAAVQDWLGLVSAVD